MNYFSKYGVHLRTIHQYHLGHMTRRRSFALCTNMVNARCQSQNPMCELENDDDNNNVAFADLRIVHPLEATCDSSHVPISTPKHIVAVAV